MKVGVVAMAIGAAGAANAQTNGPSGFSARLGIFFPTNDLARDLGSTWFAFGGDYKLTRYSVDAPTRETLSYLSISADYYEKDDLRSIPIAPENSCISRSGREPSEVERWNRIASSLIASQSL